MKEIEGETYGAEVGMDHPKKYYPRVTLTANDLPALKDWQVGESRMLVFEVKQVGASEVEQNGEKVVRGDFELHKVGTIEDMSKADFQKLVGKAKSGGMS